MSPRLSDLLLSSQSDERLVSLARNGHERAFAVIVERYRTELQALARRLCSDGRSEDIVQQAFLSAFTALRSGSEVRHLRGWLYQIVRNAAGRPQAPPSVPLDRATASGHTLEDVVQQRALAMSALSEIARLPAHQRQAMIGTALDGRARAEVAHSMGLSEGAVRQLVHRARATLRSAVTALTPWPLARSVAALGPDAPGPAELAAGAGAASSGGLALKLGALLASGTFLTGAAVQLQGAPSQRSHPRVGTAVHPPRAAAAAHPRELASVVPVASGAGRSSGPRDTGGSTAPRRAVSHSGAPHAARHPNRHEATRGTAGGSGDRQPEDRPDDGAGARASGEDSSAGSGRDGNGGASARSSGPDGHGQDGGGGGDDGTRHDGSGDGASSSGGSDGDGSAHLASASDPAGSAVDASGLGSASGDASKGSEDSGSDGGSGSGSGGGSRSGGGSGDGDGTSGG